MKAYLLYSDKEFIGVDSYFDTKSIQQDLGLKTLFSAAGKEVITERDRVVSVKKENNHLSETMKRVMMAPLLSAEEILYRQEIIKDCYVREAFIEDLYMLAKKTIDDWNKLGRKDRNRTANGNPVGNLISDIHTLKLFLDRMHELKNLLMDNEKRLHSRGFVNLLFRIKEEFTEEKEQEYRKILEDISFYIDVEEEDEMRPTLNRPKISFQFGLENGLKMYDIKLESVETRVTRFHSHNGAIAKIQDYIGGLTPNSISVNKNSALADQASMLEYTIVNYIVNCFGSFMSDTGRFFDQLYFQAAFYRGALNLKHHMQRFGVSFCYPFVCQNDHIAFTELKEVVMCMEQRVEAVGNTCDIKDKMTLVVTGANQGGKSTFLRSIGIAQIMMQCGLVVAAERYESGIFPNFFTHFTRKEDSTMNSGRLDEELKRISNIIDRIGPDSLVLLNESFASTTEKEGSEIAYDVVKALSEVDVKILTVTHLLTFAKKLYGEEKEKTDSKVTFFTAERLPDGKRTFKMIPHEPELTSFGLDLYEQVVERKEN